MANGISVHLPLTRDSDDGIQLNHDYLSVARQNLKMLVLTAPGERIMDVNFGVGARNYLFEPNAQQTHAALEARVRSQVARYIPYIAINDISFEGTSERGHLLYMKLDYTVLPLAFADSLNLTIS